MLLGALVTISSIQTGEGVLKQSFVRGSVEAGGLLPFFIGLRREQPKLNLPILAWVIDHPEGVFIVDSGDWSTTGPNPLTQVSFRIRPDEDFGPSLDLLGLGPEKPRTYLITHLHGDHVNGLNTSRASEVLLSEREYAFYRSPIGRFMTNMSCRVPATVSFKPLSFSKSPHPIFEMWAPLTSSGDVFAVPTPGHTVGHISVIAVINGVHYFLAGDLSYDQAALLSQTVQGPSMAVRQHRDSLKRTLDYVKIRPTVYLPSHDPESRARLLATQLAR